MNIIESTLSRRLMLKYSAAGVLLSAAPFPASTVEAGSVPDGEYLEKKAAAKKVVKPAFEFVLPYTRLEHVQLGEGLADGLWSIYHLEIRTSIPILRPDDLQPYFVESVMVDCRIGISSDGAVKEFPKVALAGQTVTGRNMETGEVRTFTI